MDSPFDFVTDKFDDVKLRVIQLKALGKQLKIAATLHSLFYPTEGVQYTTEQRAQVYTTFRNTAQELDQLVAEWVVAAARKG